MSRPLPADEFLRWSMLWTARHAQPALPAGSGSDITVTLH